MSTTKPKKRKKKTAAVPELTTRQIHFCSHYALNGNATQALIDAGIPHSNRVSAATAAWKLLRNGQIRDQIRTFRRQSAYAARVRVDKLAMTLDQEAHADRTAIFDGKGNVKPPHLWPADVKAAIAGYEVDVKEKPARDAAGNSMYDTAGNPVMETERTYKVRFVAPTEAKRILAQWLGMIGDKDQQLVDTASLVPEIHLHLKRGDDALPPADPPAEAANG